MVARQGRHNRVPAATFAELLTETCIPIQRVSSPLPLGHPQDLQHLGTQGLREIQARKGGHKWFEGVTGWYPILSLQNFPPGIQVKPARHVREWLCKPIDSEPDRASPRGLAVHSYYLASGEIFNGSRERRR